MARRAVRIQFEGSDGERYTIKLEGKVSRDKVQRVMDMYDLLSQDKNSEQVDEGTLYGKTRNIVLDQFSFKRFTSDQLLVAFQQRYSQSMKLAEISTYLSRLNEQGVVTRTKRGRKWLYSVPSSISPINPSNTSRHVRPEFSQIIDR